MQRTTNSLTLVPISQHYVNDIHVLLSLPETNEYNTIGIPDNIEATQSIMNTWFV